MIEEFRRHIASERRTYAAKRAFSEAVISTFT